MKFWKKLFPKAKIIEGGLEVNEEKTIPGKFKEISGKIHYISDFGIPVEVKTSNLKHFLKTGKLWWGNVSLILDGLEIQGVVFKADFGRHKTLWELLGIYYETFIPEDFTSHLYKAYVSGKLIPGRYFQVDHDLNVFEGLEKINVADLRELSESSGKNRSNEEA